MRTEKNPLAQYGVKTTISDEEWKDKALVRRKMARIHKEAQRGPAPANLVDLGGKVRAARKARGLSLEQVCEQSGANYANFSKIENGFVDPKFGTLQKLAEAMGYTLRVEFVRNYSKFEKE